MAPSHMKSVDSVSTGQVKVQTVPLPKVGDDRILVRVTAVGLNPTDWKHLEFMPVFGLRSGCDYAGVVEEIGPKVTKAFAKGDRVTGVTHGSNSSNLTDGAFAEYITVKGDLQITIPDNLSDEEAATLGVGISTVGQSLYQTLKLPLPNKPSKTPIFLLIYGASTATGILGVQFAKLSGCRSVVTCSPRFFDYVKSLGAEAAFDYKSPTAAADIKKFTEGQLQYAWDCIGSAESAELCASAMSDQGGQYTALDGGHASVIHDVNPKISAAQTLAYTIFGERFEKFGVSEPIPQDYEFGKMFWELSRELLADERIKTAKPEVNRGGKGLEGVLIGLQELKEHKVSGTKLVYTL